MAIQFILNYILIRQILVPFKGYQKFLNFLLNQAIMILEFLLKTKMEIKPDEISPTPRNFPVSFGTA